MKEEARQRFYDAIGEVLKEDQPELDVAKVTYVAEEEYNIGYCETCSYWVTELVISYTDGEGNQAQARLDTTFAELINEL